jgi:WD40 repeat protein
MKPPTPPPAVDPAQTRPVQELKHTSPLLGCRFDPSGEYVFAGAQDSSVQRWHLASGKKTSLTGLRSWCRALGFGAADKRLFTGAYDGRLIAWPVEGDAPAPLWAVQAHKGWLRALAVSPDAQTVATCGNDHLVCLWRALDGKPVRELAGHSCHVYNVAFHPDGRHLLSADLKGEVKVWDLTSGAAVRSLDAKVLWKYDPNFMADHGGVRSMAVSGDGALVACAGITDVSNAFAGVGKPAIVLFEWESGKQRFLLRPRENFQGTAWGVGFHPAGYVIGVGGGNGGALWFWKPDAAADVFALKFPNNARDLDLHPDGKRLAVAFADGAVRLYDISPKGM